MEYNQFAIENKPRRLRLDSLKMALDGRPLKLTPFFSKNAPFRLANNHFLQSLAYKTSQTISQSEILQVF